MEVTVNKESFGTEIIVKGVIKTIEDSAKFKSSVSSVISASPSENIGIHIVDSYIITSSIIGALLKFIQKDKAKITIYAYQDDLFDLLEKLNLITLMNVQKKHA